MRSARVVSSVIKTTLGWDEARDLSGAAAVICAQHDKDTIHGTALLAKCMIEGPVYPKQRCSRVFDIDGFSTFFDLTIVSFVAMLRSICGDM